MYCNYQESKELNFFNKIIFLLVESRSVGNMLDLATTLSIKIKATGPV